MDVDFDTSAPAAAGASKAPNQQNSSSNQPQHFPSLEIDSADVIRIMLQFMKENNMKESMKALSSETGVCLNTVDSVESFLNDIYQGKWESVLTQVGQLRLPTEKLVLLYEQVIH